MDDRGSGEPDKSGSPPVDLLPHRPAPDSVATEQAPTTARRILEAAAWIVGILAIGFFGRVYAVVSGSRTLSAEEIGRLIGAIVGAIVIGLLARLLVVRIRRRGRVRSPWILVVAVLVLLLNLGRDPGLGGTAAGGLPMDSYIRIGSPYSLTTPTADEAERFKAALETGTGAYEVRRVVQGDQLVAFFVIADVGSDASADFRRGLEQGWQDDGGDEPREETIGSRTVVIGTRPSGAGAFWVEPPHILTVYAADEDTAKQITAAIVGAYD
jgi:hypothetical protein